jgi:hypothetical protein
MKYLKKLYRLWLKFGLLLGTINGFIILSIFYVVIIGLYAIPSKLFKKKKIVLGTFWKDKEDKVHSIDICKYQF